MNWYLEGFRKFFDFSGRARRKEYWIFCLISLFVSFIAGFIDGFTGTFNEDTGFGFLSAFYAVIAFIPTCSVTVRRLHDTGRSGWWTLLIIIPLAGVLLLFYLVQDSNDENDYGMSPKLATV